MFDIVSLMGKVKEMQQKMQQAQENLELIKATAEAGAGMVKATVNGKKQVIRIEIDKDLLKPEDAEMLQDLIVAAVNKALIAVEDKGREEIRKATEGVLPNIPGLNLDDLMKA
ncbi:MAG: YbaB/EbfC family nucleoid-associated protein [Microscillaceae bacterium]|nr:YbaB/EbfC family nucleoid-associated protein [Microscillaceae bacterium]MDW8461911.1 YbaB/EbfC family nucleoid-associated protein [Cytophagales bacterium]